MRKNRSLISRGGMVFLVGCLLGGAVSCTPFHAPDRSGDISGLPPTYSLADAVSSPPQRWWETIDSPQLTPLVNEALTGNLTLQTYWARLAQARALAGRARSELFPSLSGDASASYATRDRDSGGMQESDQYSLGLLANYEIDLWGRIAASTRAARYSIAAGREDLHSAAVTIAAEVALRWASILTRRQERILLQQQLAINETYLELVDLRFRKSMASALDVRQQQQLVERVKAQIPLVEMALQLLHNELAVLTGRLPGELPPLAERPLPVIADLPPAGLPVQLLENRPDILAARARLGTADQQLIAARAARLPAIRLTGSAAFSGSEPAGLFDNWLTNLAAGLTAPLFTGGRLAAEVDLSAAVVEERLALYCQAVLTAVREVEDSLTREIKIREHIRWSEKQLKTARSALDEARLRYLNGLSDYLPVLTQLLSVQNLEIDLLDRKLDLLTARINLYRAVGGTWPNELSSPDFSSFAKRMENQ